MGPEERGGGGGDAAVGVDALRQGTGLGRGPAQVAEQAQGGAPVGARPTALRGKRREAPGRPGGRGGPGVRPRPGFARNDPEAAGGRGQAMQDAPRRRRSVGVAGRDEPPRRRPSRVPSRGRRRAGPGRAWSGTQPVALPTRSRWRGSPRDLPPGSRPGPARGSGGWRRGSGRRASRCRSIQLPGPPPRPSRSRRPAPHDPPPGCRRRGSEPPPRGQGRAGSGRLVRLALIAGGGVGEGGGRRRRAARRRPSRPVPPRQSRPCAGR